MLREINSVLVLKQITTLCGYHPITLRLSSSTKVKKGKVVAFLLCSIILTCNNAYAKTNNHSAFSDKTLSKQRLLFQEAEKAIELKRFTLYREKVQKLKKLGEYPLLPYLRFQYLRKRLSKQNNNSIQLFIDNNSDTPYAARLRRSWLNYLAKHKRWHDYMEIYPQKAIDYIFNTEEINKRISKASTRRACHYLTALYETKHESKSLNLVEKLWLNERSQPKACDKIFKKWQNKGFLTTELRWQRISLAMKKNKRSLAKYLAKPFKGEDKKLFSLWLSLYNKPKNILKSKLLSINHPQTNTVLEHILKRLSRKDDELALKILNSPKKYSKLPKEAQIKLRYHTGYILSKRHHPEAYQVLQQLSDKDSDKDIREWRVRAAIRQQNWPQIEQAIDRLNDDEKQSNRWQYWLAKSYTKQDKASKAKPILEKLAKKRSYYGFLAADYLKLDYNFENKQTVIKEDAIKQFSQRATVRRAFELFSLQKMLDARREWFFLTSNLSAVEDVQMAAKIAQSWAWHDRAILTIAQTSERNDLKLRFPISFSHLVDKYSKKNDVDESYTYAFIRRESAFSEQTRSPVGAIGLMQVMPATGKSVARKNRIPFNKQNLYQAEYNINIGTKYLQSMLKKYQNQIILASSAYNAGPHRVKKWQPKEKAIEADSWIETIPFNETRNYVSAILMYRAIYQYRLQQTVTKLNQQMNLFNQQQALRFADKQTKVTKANINKKSDAKKI